ncbi:hypothetical protein [Rhodopseudomonas palustris]|uniref:Intracellular septation protein A n=1 Tax=Rhodopseudomonas palustris (strain BisB18) TaxID=316056 RepID=Q212S4_RHOPB
MGILLALAPFFVFALVDRFGGATEGLIAAALVALALLIRGVVIRRETPKILDLGTALLFGGMALYASLGNPDWSLMGVRLRVDGGLLLIVLVSIAIGKPFTLQYAREHTEKERWANPSFVRSNYLITAVWALAFAVVVGADLILLYLTTWPHWVGISIIVAAMVAASKFTTWYPKHSRAAAAAAGESGAAE